MNGEWPLRPKHPLTAELVALAVLLQTLLAVPVSVRMMAPVAICAASQTEPEAAPLAPGGTSAVSHHSARTSEPGDQHPSHLCPICFAASTCPILPLEGVSIPAPQVVAQALPPAWSLAAWPPADPLPYRSRAPPAAV